MNPITFIPLYMERVWGGREMAAKLGRPLPGSNPIGESWEIVDRDGAQSVVSDGLLQGKTLHELWTDQRTEIFGEHHAKSAPRFPLLCKILDARDRLSVQVHPPAEIAPKLKGEPKTEMWYFLACDPGSLIYAGLRHGTTRGHFEQMLRRGAVEDCLHEAPTREGDSIFIPSGRLHAIGEGNLIVEIQQNSDTTYRVFDWNRTGLDGRPRDLHIEEALLSTDFGDFAPQIDHVTDGVLAECEHFRVARHTITTPALVNPPGDFALVTIVAGRGLCGGRTFAPGDFLLVPAKDSPLLAPEGDSCTVIVTTIPQT